MNVALERIGYNSVIEKKRNFIVDLNGTLYNKTDCERLGSTNYYWYHQNLQISTEMTASSGLLWHLCLVLLFAWVIVFAVMMKGLAAAGKVMTAGCGQPSNTPPSPEGRRPMHLMFILMFCVYF
jgi:hypothetical protein